MFGYLRLYKPELKIREYSVYKAVYCGLCDAIGKRYGFFMRNILSYDATLFSLIQLSMQQDCCGFETRRCPVKPFKKCDQAKQNAVIDFWADASVLLAYYKLRDNLHDENLVKKIACLLILPFASHAAKKAVKNNPFAADCIKTYVAEQAAVEDKNSASIDEAAAPTAALIAELMSFGVKEPGCLRVLARMGLFLGRWIYICDAADDFSADKKSGSYNPFVEFVRSKEGEQQANPVNTAKPLAEPLLNSCIYEITAAFELLPSVRYREILSNTFYLGLPEMEKAVLSGFSNKEKEKKFPGIYKL